ncbi:hypothetical protein PoB_004942400 [Plakobranchus ocellatus]|uniref:Uncharacterized protein n=1 Tax=Plakobranchus ocellatus TaxID=259542 RepID=A0AAV4BWX7_9GAST|nr:hypothetical protein PoB_004942400 [Plakobranchus ocellatus]
MLRQWLCWISDTHNSTDRCRANHEVQYRCQFFDRRKAKTKLQSPEKSKFRDCHSILFINIKKFFKNTVDHHMPRYCTILRLHYAHSHPLDTADVLRKRGLNPAIQQRFLEMYQHGTKPKDALDTHKKELLQKLGSDKYRQVVCDGYYVPNLAKVYRLYYQFHGKGVSAKTSSKRSSRYNPSADWLAFRCSDIRQASDDDEDDGDVAHSRSKDDNDNHASNCRIQLWKKDKNEVNTVCENGNERENKEMACRHPPPSNLMDKDLRHASDLVSAELDPANFSLSGTDSHHSQLPSCPGASVLGSRVGSCYAPAAATDCLTSEEFPQRGNADAPIKVGNATIVYSNVHAVFNPTSVLTNTSQTVVSNQSPKINTEHSITETQSVPPSYCTSNHGISDQTRGEITLSASVLLSESRPLPWRSFTSTVWSHQNCATSLTASAAADITVVSNQRYERPHQNHHQHHQNLNVQTIGSANSPSTTEDKHQCYPIQDHHHHHHHHHHQQQQQQQHLLQNHMDLQNTIVHSSHLPHNTVYQHHAPCQISQSGAYRFFQHPGMSVISSGHCHPFSCNTSSSAVSSSVNSAVLSLDPNQLHHEHHSKHQHKGHHHLSVSSQGTSHGSAGTVRSPWFFSALSHMEKTTEDGQKTRLQNMTASPTLCSSPKDASNANAMTRIVGKASTSQDKSPRYQSCNSCSTTRRRKTVRMKKTKGKMKEQNIKLLTKRWLERKPRVEAETQHLASELMGDILLREKAEKVKVRLQTFLSGVESRMTLDPKLFVPAVEKFLQVGESATDDAELAALLQGFGVKAEAGLVCQQEEKGAHVLLNTKSTQIRLSQPALKRAVMNSCATLSQTKRRRRNNVVGIPTDLNCVNSRKKKTLELMSF